MAARQTTGRRTTGTRAKDSDRDKTCKVLDTALSEGQLSMEEHRQRISAATNAMTLGDLQSLVGDLQLENSPVDLPEPKKPSPLRGKIPDAGAGWGIRVGALVAACALGIGIGWGLYGNSTSPFDFTTDPGAQPDGVEPVVLTAPKELLSLRGVVGLFTQIENTFGDTMGYSLRIYDDSANLERADPNEPRRVLSYRYQGGFGDATESNRRDDQRLVDLAAFDKEAVVAVVKGAPQTLGISENDVESIDVAIGPSTDLATGPDTVIIRIYVGSTYGESGSMVLNPDGSPRQISPVE